jgi:hypothetical protein
VRFAHATCEVDGDAAELAAAAFDFTGVYPDPNVEADLAGASRIALPQRIAWAARRTWRAGHHR